MPLSRRMRCFHNAGFDFVDYNVNASWKQVSHIYAAWCSYLLSQYVEHFHKKMGFIAPICKNTKEKNSQLLIRWRSQLSTRHFGGIFVLWKFGKRLRTSIWQPKERNMKGFFFLLVTIRLSYQSNKSNSYSNRLTRVSKFSVKIWQYYKPLITRTCLCFTLHWKQRS